VAATIAREDWGRPPGYGGPTGNPAAIMQPFKGRTADGFHGSWAAQMMPAMSAPAICVCLACFAPTAKGLLAGSSWIIF